MTSDSSRLQRSAKVCFEASSQTAWYDPVMLGPSTLGRRASQASTIRRAVDVLGKLEPDEYLTYMQSYYGQGLEGFGDDWRYSDIVTTLLAAAELVHPSSYLEIGVRRGRSMAMVAATAPECSLLGFDMWLEGYAGMPNPGPDHVGDEMRKVGHTGGIEMISGDSHKTVPAYFAAHPDAYFDIITVDGDHSEKGAALDLRTVMPHLKLGGVLVFDDITHPSHPYLLKVWKKVVASDPRFSTWEFDELGYGVALAVRRKA